VAALLEHFAAATVVSERERALLEPLAPASLLIASVPNGVDLEHNSGSFGEPEPDLLVYPGAPSYQPNFEAVSHFARAILPIVRAERPRVRLRVTGEASAAQATALEAEPGVELSGYLEDVRPTIARAWGEVVPLRRGGGTRLKVLEALALGTPVISTSKGVEGLDFEPERHLLVADTDLAFARAVVRLLNEPPLRARLSAAGRQVVRERYDWQAIGERLHRLVLDVGAGSQHAGRRHSR
jgi:glycosyltransferase involved in cell wall biosynthesis